MDNISTTINSIRIAFDGIQDNSLLNNEFIEHFLLPSLGLNNENLSEQPPELLHHMGGGLGLRIWQYPNQFSKYASLIAEHSPKIKTYMEIGCRYGGTYIFHVEMLKKLNSKFSNGIAIDIIEESQLLCEYNNTSNSLSSFLRINSGSDEFKSLLSGKVFDLVFIDGDHSYLGVKNDADITFDISNIQVFHDITSDACPGVPQYWSEHKEKHFQTHNFYEFTEQYESVSGNYLGIGVSIRKNWIQ